MNLIGIEPQELDNRIFLMVQKAMQLPVIRTTIEYADVDLTWCARSLGFEDARPIIRQIKKLRIKRKSNGKISFADFKKLKAK